jgi:hypothetical protein
VVKRSQRSAPPKVRRPGETGSPWATESHSGEGSASALETLQKLEKSRLAGKPSEPKPGDDPAR